MKSGTEPEGTIMDAPTQRIEQLIYLSSELISFADSANDEAPDEGCMCLFGLVKDCAYRIRGEAQREHLVHQARNLTGKGVEVRAS
jgi:hypothetical protein